MTDAEIHNELEHLMDVNFEAAIAACKYPEDVEKEWADFFGEDWVPEA